MRPTKIAGADPRPLGQPPGWNEEINGHCSQLFIRREVVAGVNYMRSAWEIDPDEAMMLFAGATMELAIAGNVHPVIQFGHGPLPEPFSPVMMARRFTDPEGNDVVRVEMLFPCAGEGRRAFANVKIDGSLPMAVAAGVDLIEIFARESGWTA